jgi:Fe-S cluster assembly protein SufD
MSAVADRLNINLPTNKTEEYRFTPIARVLEKAFPDGFGAGDRSQEPGIRSQETGVRSQESEFNIEELLIPGLDSFVVAVLNGRHSAALSKADGLAIRELTENEITLPDDVFAPLSKDGILIHAAEPVSKPVLVLNISTGSTSIHTSLAVKIEAGASISIIQRSINLSSTPLFQTLVEDFRVEKNGRLEYCKIQDTKNIIEVCNTSITQADNSHVNTFTLLLDGTLVRNNLSISIDGEHCESHFHGLSLLKGDTIGDHHTVVDHRKPNSFSNELYKGVMDDRSKGVFNGKIYVRPHAQKTNAFQSNRNILLTELATINTKPQLEIWADDVKCSHGCTTGQLDDEALFYLQSRGISKVDARAMLLYAFAMQTTELITTEPLKVHLESLISKRLYAQ